MKPFSNIYECNCEEFPHKYEITTEKVSFPTIDGGAVIVGPLVPGGSESFEKDGHRYVVARKALQ